MATSETDPVSINPVAVGTAADAVRRQADVVAAIATPTETGMTDGVEVDGYLVEFRILGFATYTEELVADIPLAKPDPEYFRVLMGLDDQGELLAGAYPLSDDKLKDLSERFGFHVPLGSDRPVMYTLEADRAE